MDRKKLSIGLIYIPSSDWIAGSYYVQNIILALKNCDDNNLPVIKIFCNSKQDFKILKSITRYPYLKCKTIKYAYSSIWVLIWKFIGYLHGHYTRVYGKFVEYWDNVLFVYPAINLCDFRDISKALGWIPDFQEHYLPHLFSENELKKRNEIHKSYIHNNIPLVFSSNDALNDFNKFYPQGVGLQKFVLPFAVTHPDFSNVDFHKLTIRFGITKEYLFCANQFWMHKNHLFLFKAFKIAKEHGFDMQLICSGTINDNRNNQFGQEVLDFIKENSLESDIILTGFIERTDQLCLMSHSYAIVQPSLFEGWSTVVEDAKCLNKYIYLSNLRVHIEQNPINSCYFDPNDINDLVCKLLLGKKDEVPYDYTRNVTEFGNRFLEIIDTIGSKH